MSGLSPALRWPCPAPRGLVWLSTGERLVLWAVRHQVRVGPTSTARLAALLNRPSRGQVWNDLARLRQLGLIGFRAYPVMERTGQVRRRLGGQRRPSPGCGGRLLLWIPSPARHAHRRAVDDGLRWRETVRIALTSTPYVGFSGPDRAKAWWRDRLNRGGGPPGAGSGARVGPRRGRRPPVAIRAHCPAGHLTSTGRWSWTEGPPAWIATYRGPCRVCRADVVERLVVELEPDPARPLSPDELADPELRVRRRGLARAVLVEPPGIRHLAQRMRLERDYIEGDR